MKIILQTIPHANQPYNTCGYWSRGFDGTLHINVSEEIGDKKAVLVAIHELVEVLLCEERGITCEAVDRFDIEFEKHRHPDDLSEPGDDSDAPYKFEHSVATGVERILAGALNIDWKDYEKSINALT